MSISRYGGDVYQVKCYKLCQEFPDSYSEALAFKKISIVVEAPELSKAELREILVSIKPPYSYGPYETNRGEFTIFFYRDRFQGG